MSPGTSGLTALGNSALWTLSAAAVAPIHIKLCVIQVFCPRRKQTPESSSQVKMPTASEDTGSHFARRDVELPLRVSGLTPPRKRNSIKCAENIG
jgi:hypothetical protein